MSKQTDLIWLAAAIAALAVNLAILCVRMGWA